MRAVIWLQHVVPGTRHRWSVVIGLFGALLLILLQYFVVEYTVEEVIVYGLTYASYHVASSAYFHERLSRQVKKLSIWPTTFNCHVYSNRSSLRCTIYCANTFLLLEGTRIWTILSRSTSLLSLQAVV